MPLDPLMTAAIETSLNTLLNDDPDLAKRVTRLKGQTLQLHIKELNKTLTFVFSQQVDVLAHYEGEADCRLALNLAVLPELRQQNNITDLIKQDKLEVSGDLQLAQKFAQLLKDAKPDVEEWLSRFTGDVVAHTMIQGAKGVQQWLCAQNSKNQQHLGQVLTEEWRMMPPALEVAYFCDQVTELEQMTTQLEQRLTRLWEHI